MKIGKENEIKVGDEVRNRETGGTFVVTEAGDWISGFDSNGGQFSVKKATMWERTGRHFEQVAELLKAMEEQDD